MFFWGKIMERDHSDYQKPYDSSYFIEDDGTRPWHEMNASYDLPGHRFRLWLGSDRLKFYRARIAYTINASSFQMQGGEIHPPVRCGMLWLGVSAYPLPEDWPKADAIWPGWAHLVEWYQDPQLGNTSCTPQDTFDVAVQLLKRHGYPIDKVWFSKLLMLNLGLKDKEATGQWVSFPYLEKAA